MIAAGSSSATGPATDAVARVPLRVLRVGAGGAAPLDGAEALSWAGADLELPAALAHRPLAAIAQGVARLDTAPIAWADVVLFAPPFATIPACLDCEAADPDDAELIAHAASTGHPWRRPVDELVRGLLMIADAEPATWRGRGRVVDLAAGDPFASVPRVEHDLVRLLLGSADAVLAPDEPTARAAVAGGAAADRLVVAGEGPAGAAHRLEALRRAAAAHDPARLARRLALRAADADAAGWLADRAARGLPAWDPRAGVDPRVTVVVPVTGEPADLAGRAVASALACPGVRLDVVVAGEAGSAAPRVVEAAGHERVSWAVAAGPGRTAALAAALGVAAGDWIAPLDPASLLADEHPATLLAVALEHGLDAVYAQTLLVADGEPRALLGAWPPAADTVAHDASLFSASLRAFAVDPDAEADGEDPRWNLWRRWAEAGARLASVDGPLAIREAGA